MKMILFLNLFSGHLLADFYFQTSKIARQKDFSLKYLLLHCLIYALILSGVCLPIMNHNVLVIAVLVSLVHLMIDGGKFFVLRRFSFNEMQQIGGYCIDQLLHFLTIFFFSMVSFKVEFLTALKNFLTLFPFDPAVFMGWICLLLFVGKPASITIRKILDHFDPQTPDEGIKNAGSLIGILERLIILLLLSAGQYSAIGFVLTAKSVARYNKISEEPQFAEYYLLGTLLSTLLVIASFQLIFKGVLA